MEAKPQIPEFYAGKTVLVTGCTGFIGKVLIWKLLHSCPSIKQIYILLRLKGDKTIEDRQKEFFKCPIFDNFTSSNSNLLTKVIPVQGDVVVDNLGLSKSDEQMLVNNVSIVFYGAALLKMDATLKQAINVNTKGVIRCLDIALKMKKLTAFVYISTAYSCSEESYVEEKIYYMNENPATIIASLECLTQPMLDKITQDIIAPLPNTYTFSKRLTELLLVEYEAKLPVIIARPTIVVASHKEPIPGWIDNLNGAVGFGAAIGSGILHSMYIRKENRGDLVPVDIVCNTLIAIPWAEEKNILIKETPIYNIAVIDHEQVSWGLYAEIGEQAIMKYPFKLMLWYPTFHVFQSNWFLHKLEAIIYHWIPAYLIDFMLFLLGRKTFMVRIQRKVFRGMQLLSYFTKRQWTFQTNSVRRLKKMLNDADQRIFPVTEEHVDGELILTNGILNLRKHVFGENFETPEQYQGRLKLYFVIKVIAKLAMYYLLFKSFVIIFKTSYNAFKP